MARPQLLLRAERRASISPAAAAAPALVSPLVHRMPVAYCPTAGPSCAGSTACSRTSCARGGLRQQPRGPSGYKQTLSARADTRCHAVKELSTYSFGMQPLVLHWFHKAVQDIASSVRSESFLHLVYPEPELVSRQLLISRLDNYQQLPDLYELGSGHDKPEVRILVEPIFDPELEALSQPTKAGGRQAQLGVRKSQSPAAHRSQPQSHAPVFHGKVGDCCDDEEDEGASASASLAHSSLAPEYYGLVVQTHYRSDVEGCFLLKVVRREESSGCHCIHYSLSRVFQHAPLFQQLIDSWLV